MKYTITHSCGHEEQVELFGKAADRDRKVAAMESEPCSECRAKEAHVDGLPDLEGSPKQVAWAGDIRKQFIVRWAENLEKFAQNAEAGRKKMEEKKAAGENVEKYETQYKKITEALEKAQRIFGGIKKETSASWFIENRNYAGCDPAKEYYSSQMFREKFEK